MQQLPQKPLKKNTLADQKERQKEISAFAKEVGMTQAELLDILKSGKSKGYEGIGKINYLKQHRAESQAHKVAAAAKAQFFAMLSQADVPLTPARTQTLLASQDRQVLRRLALNPDVSGETLLKILDIATQRVQTGDIDVGRLELLKTLARGLPFSYAGVVEDLIGQARGLLQPYIPEPEPEEEDAQLEDVSSDSDLPEPQHVPTKPLKRRSPNKNSKSDDDDEPYRETGDVTGIFE